MISQVVVMEREKCDEVVEKLESMENNCKTWLLNALQHSLVGRFPTELSQFCGTRFNPHIDPASCGKQVQRTSTT